MSDIDTLAREILTVACNPPMLTFDECQAAEQSIAAKLREHDAEREQRANDTIARSGKLAEKCDTLTAENAELKAEIKEGVRMLVEHNFVYQDGRDIRTCVVCGTDYRHDPNLPPEEIEPCYFPDCKLGLYLQRNGGTTALRSTVENKEEES